MKFFEFCQNNSGGRFVFDKEAGITHIVIIEARNAVDANRRAEEIGLYFDGCDDGRDCSCCGDRWSAAYGKGDAAPSHYGEPIEGGMIPQPASWKHIKWMGDNPEGVIHYADGRKVWIDYEE